MNQEIFNPFWRRHLKGIIVSIVLGVFALVGIQMRDHYQTKPTAEASVKFDSLIAVSQLKKTDEANKISEELIQQYSKTLYAPLASFVMAKLSIEKDDLPAAERYLRLAIQLDRKGTVKPIATERLARVLSEQKQYDEALQLLNLKNVSNHYAVLFEETKGDIYLSKNDRENAKLSYEAAAKALPSGVSDNRLQLKLIELGAKEGS